VFTKLAVSTSGLPHRFLIDGATPGWIATSGFVYQRQPDGVYKEVGPAASAISLAVNGRFFMAGGGGRILAQRAP
jgi:hypothetical protein